MVGNGPSPAGTKSVPKRPSSRTSIRFTPGARYRRTRSADATACPPTSAVNSTVFGSTFAVIIGEAVSASTGVIDQRNPIGSTPW
jgi:hypothetical protein